MKAATALLALVGCATTGPGGDLDVATLPPELRADYDLFARRCSKCHSLARPLNSGIVHEAVWDGYVERMRALPGSGISPEDSVGILRFLHYFAAEERRKRQPFAPAEAAK